MNRKIKRETFTPSSSACFLMTTSSSLSMRSWIVVQEKHFVPFLLMFGKF